MINPKGNSEFCFPETLNIPQGKAKGFIEGFLWGQLTVSLYLPTQNRTVHECQLTTLLQNVTNASNLHIIYSDEGLTSETSVSILCFFTV